MNFLSWLAWAVFGGMGAKDAYDNQKYISESKQRMIDDDRLFYCDGKGKMYYKYTGEEIMQSFRDNRKVYINVRTGAVVCDLSSIDYQRHLKELSKEFRHSNVRVDKGKQWCDIDFEDWRFYRLKKEPIFKTGTYDIVDWTHWKKHYKENADHYLVEDGEWFKISKEEYDDLGGAKACGPTMTLSPQARKHLTGTTKRK